MAAEDDDDKQYDPSPKKLEDARKKGEIPRSNDISVAVSYAAFLLAAVILGPWSVDRVGALGVILLQGIDSRYAVFFAGASAAPPLGLLVQLGSALLPVLLLPAAAVILSLLAQRAITFVPDKLRPKLSRISPLSNAKNKFGRSGLFEFAKSATKLILISVIMGIFLWKHAEEIIGTMMLSHVSVSRKIGSLAIDFLAILVVLFGAIGAVDFLWQVSEHRRKNRMSHKELRDETKESEGDPYMKQARRSRAQAIALNKMISDVPTAAVVVVNPEHYAVALRWDVSQAGAPICVAKGVDEIAARIREVANEHGVPIRRDPPFARALHATTEVGDEIQPEHYKAAAAAIRFAEKMRKIARGKMT